MRARAIGRHNPRLLLLFTCPSGRKARQRVAMISSLAWLPRGVAKAVPELAQPSGARLAWLRVSAVL